MIRPGTTFASIVGAKLRDDRPIDGADQTGVTACRLDRVAARRKQWRVYFTDVYSTGIGPQRQPGPASASILWPLTRRSSTSRLTT